MGGGGGGGEKHAKHWNRLNIIWKRRLGWMQPCMARLAIYFTLTARVNVAALSLHMGGSAWL